MMTKGMTLIELVIVLAILVALSGAVVAMTDKLDANARDQETSRRLAAIRGAVLGPDVVSSDGRLLSGGYLQDMGRLPDSLDDLVVKPASSPAYALDGQWQTWAGWRGPYVTPLPARTGHAALYDDWGDDFTAALDVDGNWSVGSPHTLPSANPLVHANAWRVDLSGLRVRIANRSDHDFTTAPARFRILVPRHGAVGDTDPADPLVSDVFTIGLGPVAGGNDVRVTAFPAHAALVVPCGRRRLVLVEAVSGLPFTGFEAGAELAVSPRLQPDDPLPLEIVRR